MRFPGCFLCISLENIRKLIVMIHSGFLIFPGVLKYTCGINGLSVA